LVHAAITGRIIDRWLEDPAPHEFASCRPARLHALKSFEHLLGAA
jgi:hypothetical protein